MFDPVNVRFLRNLREMSGKYPGNVQEISGNFPYRGQLTDTSYAYMTALIVDPFFCLTSTRHHEVTSGRNLQKRWISDISRKFIGNFQGIPRHCIEHSRTCPGHFLEISQKRVGFCLEMYRIFSRTFPGNVPDISWTIPGHFPETSRAFPEQFPEIFRHRKLRKECGT